jgi:hypothetical protein
MHSNKDDPNLSEAFLRTEEEHLNKPTVDVVCANSDHDDPIWIF